MAVRSNEIIGVRVYEAIACGKWRENLVHHVA